MEEQVLDLAIERVSSGDYTLDELQDILDMVSHILA